MAYVSNDELFPVFREPRSVWERTGLTERQRRVLDLAMLGVATLLLLGWIYSTAQAMAGGYSAGIVRRVGERPSSPATFTLEAAMGALANWEEYRGESGAVRIIVQQPGDTLRPDSLPRGVQVGYAPVTDTTAPPRPAPGGVAPQTPGVWNVLLQVRDAVRRVPDLNIVTLVPASEMTAGRIGDYRIGSWPGGEGEYAPPAGFIRVMPEDLQTPVSEHVVLGDFMTKGQEGVWPKYVVIQPQALDKVELTIQELNRRGVRVDNIFAVSGFRTPWYNEAGGDPRGRGALSRHMYGDALDFAVDNDGDGRMDDLNGDGEVTKADAQVIADAAEEVERTHPTMVGGIGVYAPTGAHSGFVHLDTRGYRARW